ncbi:MAG: phosphoadenosine phosphosulfate reductase family protein [Methylophilaceae bacterium]
MVKIRKKQYLEKDVYEAAKERLVKIFNNYDKVVVNFSAGKDSTALLYLAIEVAKEIGKLPVEVLAVDHEIEGLGTIALWDAVNEMKEVDFKFYSLPMALRNACSLQYPIWYSRHPAEKELWIRDIPEYAITEMENFVFEYDESYQHPDGLPFKAGGVRKSMSFQDIADTYINNYRSKGITAIALVGLRASESLARFTVMTRKHNECYISTNNPLAYPIYDWTAVDVWKYIRETGLPYNTEYDILNKTADYNKLEKQRVGSIFAEEALRTLDQWQEIYGDYWHKILERVEGVKTAWRYNNDGIYTGTNTEKRPDISWKEYTTVLLNQMSAENKALCSKTMNKIMVYHRNQTDYPITDRAQDACPLTGVSWEFLARIAVRGDTKERQLQRLPQLAKKARGKYKMTREEAIEKFGTEQYKRKFYEEQRRKAQTP